MSASTLVSKWHGERANFSSASPLRNTAIVSPRRSYRFGSAPLQLYSSYPLSFLGGPVGLAPIRCSMCPLLLPQLCIAFLCLRSRTLRARRWCGLSFAWQGTTRPLRYFSTRSVSPAAACCPCPAICSLCPCPLPCPCTCSRPPQILALHFYPRLPSCFLSSLP